MRPKGRQPETITLPRHVPLPALPSDNPLLRERVTLGEKLFRDPRLSRTDTLSCSSCHQDHHVFTDPRQFSPGVDGKHPARHSMPLFNLAWKSSFFWDGRAPSLRAQTLIPIEDHLEMDESLDRVIAKLADDGTYMHDGSFATLEEVIDHYNDGFQRSATLDPNLAKHPQGLGLSEEDKAALVAFLKTLADPQMEK